MGGAARAALNAAILALAVFCVAGAQGKVTLSGATAQQVSGALTIDLATSAPAEFKLDRFTMGAWVFVWSPKLKVDTGEQKVNCDLSAPELAGSITTAHDGKRAGVRIYLGRDADRRGVTIEQTKSGVRVTVPDIRSKVGNPLAKPATAAKGTSATTDARNVPVADYGSSGTLDYELYPAIPPISDSGTPMPAADGYIPDQAKTPADQAADQTAPPAAPERRTEPTSSGMTGRTTKGGKGGKPSSKTPEGTSGFTTPSGAVIGGPQQEAKISVSDTATPIDGDGKDSLKSIKIDLFEIVNEPLGQAIQLLVSPTGYNAIVDSSVDSNIVSLSFKEGTTDLKSALDLLSRTYGLEYMVEAHTIIVGPKDKVYGNLIPYETRLFVLSYADPQSVRDILITTGVLPDNQIEFYGGEQDYPNVNDSTALSSAETSSDILPIETNVSSTPRNAVLVRGTPDQLDYVAQVIGQLDRKPMQIQLEVRVCEANDDAIKELGITTDQTISTVFSEVGTATDDNDKFPFTHFDANQLGSFNRNGGLSFKAQLHAQIQNGNIKVLAQPVITTTDGKQAIWFAGDKLPYTKTPLVSTGNSFQAPQVEFISVGVVLSFKPRLDKDGLITIDANPRVSSLVDFLDIGGGAKAPQTQDRQIHSTIRVHDGETFSLAGLISETERRTTVKVPGLGDIPIVGRLFRDKKTDKTRTEIIVLVTPKIVE